MRTNLNNFDRPKEDAAASGRPAPNRPFKPKCSCIRCAAVGGLRSPKLNGPGGHQKPKARAIVDRVELNFLMWMPIRMPTIRSERFAPYAACPLTMPNTTAWSRLTRWLFGVMLLATGSTFAQTSELTDSADHPVLKRFTGSVITGYAVEDWGQAKLPGSAKLSADKR